MAGFLPFCDLMLYEMKQADEACFKYTGSKLTVSIKHTMSYIFFFIPQTIFLILFYPLNVIFLKWFFNLKLLIFFSDILKIFKDCLELPSLLMLEYFRWKKGNPEAILLRMWKNPFIPYVTVCVYRDERCLEDPPYPEGAAC